MSMYICGTYKKYLYIGIYIIKHHEENIGFRIVAQHSEIYCEVWGFRGINLDKIMIQIIDKMD